MMRIVVFLAVTFADGAYEFGVVYPVSTGA